MRTPSTIESDAATKELFDLLDWHIPLDLRADFLRMRAGEPVPKVRRERVLQAAREILESPRQYESQRPNMTFEDLEPDNLFDDWDDCDE